ncbi:MAG TPA: hypothetical protein VM287_11875 [Egibacteraceae bacterium]|nr:hypothetical protein [Egibacteraceae bacterium]
MRRSTRSLALLAAAVLTLAMMSPALAHSSQDDRRGGGPQQEDRRAEAERDRRDSRNRTDRDGRDRRARDGRLAFAVNVTHDTVAANIGDGKCADASGQCSLRAAVQESNAASSPAVIKLDAKVYQLTIAGAGENEAARGDLDITGDVVVDGRGATIDAAGLDRAFDVQGGSLWLQKVTLTGGAPSAGEGGGAVRSTGTLSLKRVHLTANAVTGDGASGGAVLNDGGVLHAEHSEMRNNTAIRAGGAIEAVAGTTNLDRVVLAENHTGPAPGNGGGLHLTGAGAVTVTNSVVVRNTATAEGGGLWNSATGTMDVRHSRVNGNVASGGDADQGGGGLYNDGGLLTVSGGQVKGNAADGAAGSGGGILNNEGTLVVSSTVIAGNSAKRAGGGIEAVAGTTELDRVRLAGNNTGPAPGNGGGLHLTGAGAVTVTNSVVVGNTATAEGGGLWNSATGTMTVTHTVIRNNHAPEGPDVYNDGGTFLVDGEPVPIG